MSEIPTQDTLKIDDVNRNLLAKITPQIDIIYCPKDGEELIKFTDYNIPKHAHIYRCHKCEGVFFNKGDLVAYKKLVLGRKFENENLVKNQEEKYDQFVQNERTQYLVNTVANGLAPALPFYLGQTVGSNEPPPFTLSGEAVNLLKQVPEEKKIQIYRMMAREYQQDLDDEEQFLKATASIINIISALLRIK